MAAANDVDLLVIGGGCAGLSLARALANVSGDLRTLLIEPRTDYVDDRTWCFWSGSKHDNRHLVRRAWNRWRFSSGRQHAVQQSTDALRYQCVRSIDFYEDAIDTIQASNRMHLATGVEAQSVERHDALVEVSTSSGLVRARHVVDTRPSNFRARDDAPMYQVFVGAEVSADRDAFDPEVVGLMDDMSADELGFRFTYILPFTKRSALIEETRFSTAPVTADVLRNGLGRTLDGFGGSIEIVRTESGRLPMTTNRRSGDGDPSVVAAGVGGGAIRASTGYAFARIQQWADDCSRQLASGGPPLGHAPDPLWRQAVDRLFLQVLRAQPELGPRMFMAMGERLSAATLVRFLSDDCRPADFARVAGVLPKSPFIRQLMLEVGAVRS